MASRLTSATQIRSGSFVALFSLAQSHGHTHRAGADKNQRGESGFWNLPLIILLHHFYVDRKNPLEAHGTQANQSSLLGLVPFILLNMSLQVWMVGEDGEDLKNHRELLPLSKLQEIGVLYWHLDPKKPESEQELAKIRKDRGYSYMDFLDICPGKLANFEEKLKNFFTEHMHADEEIRYCLEGGGYFDVRDKDDKWVRIWIKEGDMIVLPAGIYHRFTLDAANHVKLMRLFLGEPVWTAHNRPQEDHPVRQEYVKRLTDDNAGVALAAH